jgi:O-antigen/teichoic acid export membrane protein
MQTAGFNLAANAAAAGGVILARAVGPAVRGEYAAVVSWFGIALMLGEIGQPAAICFYVAQDPGRARDYVATSRAMMLVTGMLALGVGVLLAPMLAHGHPDLAAAYRIAFAGLIVALVGDSYTFALQARDLHIWNKVRTSQPAFSVVGIGVLWLFRWLSLDTAIAMLITTLLIELGWAYRACFRTGLASGQMRADLVRPLAVYGAAQIVSVAPAAVNIYLDQLVLSQMVPAVDLGHYAIAASMTLLPLPLVSAIGYVAFPRLAAQSVITQRSHRLQQMAVLASAGLAAGMLIPLATAAYWLVPLVFGLAYRGAVPLLWILTPGGIFLACGQVVGDLLRGRKQQMVVARSQGLAAIFTVVLLFVLVPFLGVAGAAIASTVAYGVALAVMIRCLWRLPNDADPEVGQGQGVASV